ncbi:Hydroxymethylpyrimidine/phosphomethylpyrimidine kinase [Sinobacterium norvegicum]|uniref:hydroxymethylpyrimidine kinase n=1 Tax=Sinobacterium norvegicum TaxID=1641715 RepID=A0ABN8EKC4_9GAMM|nr:hydroxymethylpyrimidine/phosphomethylpyrimidine kinase [Sinobacterium norvegicum]CAH0992807.1 Hydroxymethylpyrimidine/phosphomethylpyrimidine kinase [Sinobacterium norvegicum]
MPSLDTQTPVVVSFSQLDPSGADGLQADIETLASLGVHCCPINTSASIQDSKALQHNEAAETTVIIEQARAILEDMPVKAFKIGWCGSIKNMEAIHTILIDYPEIPVILDPGLNIAKLAGGDKFITAIRALLLPLADIIVLNSSEARQLAPDADGLKACACEILTFGGEHVLITDGKNQKDTVTGHLFNIHGLLKEYPQERINQDFHGAGSTLSASISAYISHDFSLFETLQQAHKYTRECLTHGRRIGMGKWQPNRLYWAE